MFWLIRNGLVPITLIECCRLLVREVQVLVLWVGILLNTLSDRELFSRVRCQNQLHTTLLYVEFNRTVGRMNMFWVWEREPESNFFPLHLDVVVDSRLSAQGQKVWVTTDWVFWFRFDRFETRGQRPGGGQRRVSTTFEISRAADSR